MNNEVIENLQKKYPFLTSLEAKTLYLIAKNDISFEYVNSLKTSLISTYLVKYTKSIRNNNNLKSLKPNVDVKNSHLDVLFLLKKKKFSLKRICKILEKNKDIDVSYHPFNRVIVKMTKRNVFINKGFSYCMMFASISVMSYCLLNINSWHKENVKIEKISADVVDKVDIVEEQPKDEEIIDDDYFKYMNVSLLDVDLNELLNQNSDTKGWIKVNGTNINYPFVQSDDNEYYLYHSFDGAYNSKGWVFMDYRNDINNLNKNTILYAHGLVNNAMFGSLRKTLKTAWQENEENRIIKVSTLTQNLLWEVFSTYKIYPEGYYITTDFSSDAEYEKFLDTLKSRSLYDYGVDLSTDDKILTLSSCYDNSERMVVHAKLIAVSNKNN